MRISILKAFQHLSEDVRKKLEYAGYTEENGHNVRLLIQTILKVEMAVLTLKEFFPKEKDPRSIPYLFYTMKFPSYKTIQPDKMTMLANVHSLLSNWRINKVVQTHLRDYFNIQNVSLHVRIMDGKLEWVPFSKGDREESYREVLSKPLPLHSSPATYPNEQTVYFIEKDRKIRLSLPDYFLPGKKQETIPLDHVDENRNPIWINIHELLETAKRMDEKCHKNWHQRLRDIVFLDPIENLKEAEELQIIGTQHFAGPLSVGKTTTMQVIATHLAERNHVTTLVVKDIAEVLTLIDDFDRYNIKAVPVISWRNRDNHIRQYIQTFSDEERFSMDIMNNPAFRYLSKGCQVRAQMGDPMFESSPPCFELYEKEDENNKYKRGKSCPYFSQCEYHRMYHDLPSAQVYITTLQSLLYANLPPAISGKKMLMLEYILRRSHLIMMDESDRLQFTSDQIFIPSEDTNRWLQKIQRNLERTLEKHPYQSWKTADSSRWITHFHQARAIYHNMRVMLQSSETEDTIRKFIGKQAFTGGKLFSMLAMEISGTTWEKETGDFKLLKTLSEDFHTFYEEYRNDAEWEEELPSTRHPLFSIAENADERDQIRQIRGYLGELTRKYRVSLKDSEKVEKQLRFALLTASFEKRVYYLSHHFSYVRDDLNLDEGHASIFRGMPSEYDSLIPISPTGIQFGFRYEYSQGNSGGKLELFRYLGIGRHLLNSFSTLFSNLDQIPGAHTVLLSGTSFAPYSAKYDLHLPLRYVMKDREDRQSKIRYVALPSNISVSGSFGDERSRRLQKLVEYAVKYDIIDKAIESFPIGRKRLMLIVGSYEEAAVVVKTLRRMKYTMEDQIFALNPDIDQENHPEEWKFQRQKLARFSEGNGKILIAPLMAVERGHNILTYLDNQIVAAFGGLMYLVRPYPIPNELAGMASRINHWALHAFQDDRRIKDTLYEEFQGLRRAAYQIQTDYFRYNLGYKHLRPLERLHLLMDLNTICWQLEGRLIRGYVGATVYYLDGAFFPMRSIGASDTAETSTVLGWNQAYEKILKELPPVQARIFHLLYHSRIEGINKLEWI